MTSCNRFDEQAEQAVFDEHQVASSLILTGWLQLGEIDKFAANCFNKAGTCSKLVAFLAVYDRHRLILDARLVTNLETISL